MDCTGGGIKSSLDQHTKRYNVDRGTFGSLYDRKSSDSPVKSATQRILVSMPMTPATNARFFLSSDEKNRNSRILGHVNFRVQNDCFAYKRNKNGLVSGFWCDPEGRKEEKKEERGGS